ncbi:MAG: type IV pilus assembly protein PilM [Candidatus Omnitrophota bacterium]
MTPKIKQITSQLDQEINLFEPGQKLMGIDIGSTLIKIAVIKESPVGTRLVGIGLSEIPPPPPNETDEETRLRISSSLKEALSQVKTKAKKVCTIINTASLNIKPISLPAMPEEELKESVKWEMEQNINFPIDTATFDFLVSGETIRSGVKNLELEVVAAKTEEIKKHMQIYMQNKLTIESINIHSFCLWNVFQKSNQWKEDDTIALLNLGAKTSTINIYSKNILRFNREIFFGGETLTAILAKELNLPTKEVKELLDRYGLIDKSGQYEKISESLKQLVGQIDRSFGYYKAQFHIERIDRMVIYGGASKLINLDKFLSEELGIFAEIGEPFNGLLFDQKSFANLTDFASFFSIAIGAAINSGIPKRINLLPAEFRKDKKVKLKKTLAKIVPAIIIITLVSIYVSLINKEKSLLHEEKAKNDIINVWKNQQELERKIKFLDSIPTTHQSWIEIFKGISSVIPEGVWFDSIAMDEPQKSLVIIGAGQSNILIIELVRKLESLPYFNSVKLESVGEITAGQITIINFRIRIGKN